MCTEYLYPKWKQRCICNSYGSVELEISDTDTMPYYSEASEPDIQPEKPFTSFPVNHQPEQKLSRGFRGTLKLH